MDIGGKQRDIYFPPGVYVINGPIVFNYDGELTIVFQGAGAGVSVISANFADFVLKRSNSNPTSGVRVVRDLQIYNGNAAGGGILLMGSIGTSVENCKIFARRGIVHDYAHTNTVYNTKLTWNNIADSYRH